VSGEWVVGGGEEVSKGCRWWAEVEDKDDG